MGEATEFIVGLFALMGIIIVCGVLAGGYVGLIMWVAIETMFWLM